MRAKTMLALAAAVAGLVVNGPSVWPATYTGGSGDCWSMGAMTNDVGLGGAKVAISSAANQSFFRGYAPVGISTITITDDNPPGITNGGSIAVCIPADIAMTWDETDLTAMFGGAASGKVGSIGYTGSNRRLTMAVLANFIAGDTLTISALSFKNYLASGNTRLELDFDNDGIADAQDGKTIAILAAFSYGGPRDSHAMDGMSKDKGLRVSGTIHVIR